MKASTSILLIIGLFSLAYCFLAKPVHRGRLPDTSQPAPAGATTMPATTSGVGNASPAKAESEGSPSMPEHQPALLPEPERVGSQAPAVVVPAPAANDELPTVERYTENWTKFPSSAFPRAVKLTKDARFGLPQGIMLLKAGTEVVALEWRPGGLVVTPSKDSMVRTVVPLETTDFKSRMTEIYNAWRARQTASVPAPEPPHPPVAAVNPVAARVVEEDGSPVVSLDGTISMLLAAMKSGVVSEITPHNVTHWGRPTQEVINGRKTWKVKVDYTSSTQLGPMDAETVVHIRDGKIEAWVFEGTNEPVP